MNVKDATAKRIELICKERCITYNELANICGLTPSTIYSIMDPHRKNISLQIIKIICDSLHMRLADFFDHPVFDTLDEEPI